MTLGFNILDETEFLNKVLKMVWCSNYFVQPLYVLVKHVVLRDRICSALSVKNTEIDSKYLLKEFKF